MFVTFLCAVFEPASRRLILANGGHCYPLLVPADDSPRWLFKTMGTALGFESGVPVTLNGNKRTPLQMVKELNAIGGRNACAFDLGAPVSVSLFQRIRLLTFVTPGFAWDARCIFSGSRPGGASTFLAAGFGLQQLGSRSLDVSFGVQRIFRTGSGVQLGVNVTYVRLP
jgi:hypothetical protein